MRSNSPIKKEENWRPIKVGVTDPNIYRNKITKITTKDRVKYVDIFSGIPKTAKSNNGVIRAYVASQINLSTSKVRLKGIKTIIPVKVLERKCIIKFFMA